MVHGDDFTALATPEGLDLYEAGMCKAFECKLKGRLGRGEGDLKEMRVLNRIVRIDDHGLRYEADPRHVELLAGSLKLEQCKHADTPGVKLPFDEKDADATDGNLDDHIVDASVNVLKKRDRIIKFNDVAEYYDVPTQLDTYGAPPRTFDFDHNGRMIPGLCDPRRSMLSLWHQRRTQTIVEPYLNTHSATVLHGRCPPLNFWLK